MEREPGGMSIAHGTAVVVAMRWTDRLIGLVSTLILARLLTPEDFGIIAMASLAVALADVLLDFGVNVALIQNRDATQAHYDTAWTLRLLQTSAATMILVLSAPLAAAYFQDARVQTVLQVLPFSLMLAGFENIGIVTFQKHMRFGAEFRFLFLRRMAGFLTTILLAWLLRSYWALVIGTLVGRTVGVGLSYWLHPMRPRFSFEKFREIFSVSQWMLVRSIGIYLHQNLHKILVGRWTQATTMGAYSLADQISGMPSGELLAPLNRVLFPAFAAAKDDLPQLRRIFLLAQSVQTLVAIPAAAGLALIAYDIVLLLLGEKWLIAVPFIEILALVNIVQALTTSGGYVLIVLGKIRITAISIWINVLVFGGLAYTVIPGNEALEIAWLRLIIVTAGVWLSCWLLIKTIPGLRFRDFVRSSIRPLLGAAAMAAVLSDRFNYFELPLAALVALKIGLGAVTYVATVLSLWWLAGHPPGAEAYFLKKCRGAWGRMGMRHPAS
jgi:lipopolysaccharide exporter